MRTEHDFLGDLQVPDEVYYGVQTLRGKENFHITGQTIDPEFVQAMAKVECALNGRELEELAPYVVRGWILASK